MQFEYKYFAERRSFWQIQRKVQEAEISRDLNLLVTVYNL